MMFIKMVFLENIIATWLLMCSFKTIFCGDKLNYDITNFSFFKDEQNPETVISEESVQLRKPKFVEIYPNGAVLQHYIHKPHTRKPFELKHSINETDRKGIQYNNNDLQLEADDYEFTKYLPVNLNDEIGTIYSVTEIQDSHAFSDYNNRISPSHPPFHTKEDSIYQDPVNFNADIVSDENNNNYFVSNDFLIPDSENFGSYYRPPVSNEDDSKDQNQIFPNQNFQTYTEPYSYIQKITENRRSSTTEATADIEVYSNKYLEEDLVEAPRSDTRIKPIEFKKDARPTENKIKTLINNSLLKLLEIQSKPKNEEQNSYIHAFQYDTDNSTLDLTNGTIVRDNRKYSESVISNATATPTSKNDMESKLFYSSYFWEIKNKIKNLFSLFTIIKFNNTECNATNWAGTWQGICLTADQCTQSNGSALASCANGYGVCCVFRGSCGDSSSMNCSYFKSPNYPDYYPSDGGVITPTTTTTTTIAPTPDPRLYWYYFGQNRRSTDKLLSDIVLGRQVISNTMSCIFSVYKTNSNIQQFRIDFIDLDLEGPTNGTCTNERLVITGQNSNSRIPVLCGYNTGQHIYVDVSQLEGPLKIMVLSTTGARKRFKMKICQYSDSCSTSQSNCLQYYTGVTGTIQSFNYDQAAMFNRSVPGYFNDLNYAICIRREAGYCSITYMNTNDGEMYPFQLVNILPNGQSTVPAGQAGVDVLNCPDDYIIIDGTRLCGDRLNDGSTSANFSTDASVTDMSSGPIVVNVRTNDNITGLGFKFFYTQNVCPS